MCRCGRARCSPSPRTRVPHRRRKWRRFVATPEPTAIKPRLKPRADRQGPRAYLARRGRRAGAERAAGGLDRVASAAAAAGARTRAAGTAPAVTAPAVTAPAITAPPAVPTRPGVVKTPKAVLPPEPLAFRDRLNALGSRMSASGRTAAMLMAVTMLAAVAQHLDPGCAAGAPLGAGTSCEISAAVYQQSEARQFLLAFTLLVLYIVSAVAFLVWIQRSYARLRARRIAGLRYTPLTAVIWFLVPVAFLFIPRRVVSELWHASPAPAGGRVDRRGGVPMLVSVWWTAFVAFALSAVITGATTPNPTITDLFRQTWTNLAADLLALLAAALAIVLIAAIELRQPAN